MKEIIIISKGKNHTCLVDDKDYNLVKDYSWSLTGDGDKGYAQTCLRGSKPKKFICMHRLILGILNNPEIETDHKNHNKLDNRRFNIRQCNHSENCKNTTARGKSKYLGVSIVKSKNQYNEYIRAQIKINGKSKHLGYFNTEIEAAKIYDEQAKIDHGEFANLNFK